MLKDRLLSKGIYCTKFGNFQAWDQIWNGKQLYRGQQFDSDLWQCDIKINREHLLSGGIHCANFGNFQAKGWKGRHESIMLP